MTSRHIPDDRRYMTHEVRAIDDARYRGKVECKVAAVTTCYCGKTVTHEHGRPVMVGGKPIECPRHCERAR